MIRRLGWARAVPAASMTSTRWLWPGWSVDEHYLLDLASAGVAIVPTTVVEVGEEPAIPAADIAVKPAVGRADLLGKDAVRRRPEAGRVLSTDVGDGRTRGPSAVCQAIRPTWVGGEQLVAVPPVQRPELTRVLIQRPCPNVGTLVEAHQATALEERVESSRPG